LTNIGVICAIPRGTASSERRAIAFESGPGIEVFSFIEDMESVRRQSGSQDYSHHLQTEAI
jgi:hypothetical protein